MKKSCKIFCYLFFVILFVHSPSLFAEDFKLPSCSQLEKWATGFDKNARFNLTPSLEVNKLFSAEKVQPLFGTKVLDWDDNQRQEVGQFLRQCRSDASKRRDKNASGQIYKTIKAYRDVSSAAQRIKRITERAENEVQALIDQQPAPGLLKAIKLAQEALLGKDVQQQIRTDRELGYMGGKASNLQAFYVYLTPETSQRLIALLQQKEKMAIADQQLIDEELAAAGKELEGAPNTQEGLITLQKLSQAPVLEKISRDDARVFRDAINKKQQAIRWILQQQAEKKKQLAEAEARRPIDLRERLKLLFVEDDVEDITLKGLYPGMPRPQAVNLLQKKWNFNFDGGLNIFNNFVPERKIYPQLKAERRNGGKVELEIMDNNAVGQIKYVEYYKAMVIDSTPQAWLSDQLGQPDEVSFGSGGRLLTWKDGSRRLQVMASNQVDVLWGGAGYVSRMLVALWSEDYEEYLVRLNERCDEIRKKPRNQWSMEDAALFTQKGCPMGAGYLIVPGL